MSDQYWISPYQINTVSSKSEKNREKNICRRIICWSITKFFEVTSEELYARENTYEILEVKWLKVKADSSTVQVLNISRWLFPKVFFFYLKNI